jgi:hypothetical protein
MHCLPAPWNWSTVFDCPKGAWSSLPTVYRTPWITAPFGPSGARYRAETAITLAMTSADIIIHFMFDFPLRCPPTQIAKARPYRMDKARVWSKQNTLGKYWNGDTNPVL